MEKKDIVSYNYDELQDEIKSIGEKPFRAKQIYAWLHEKLAEEFDEMTNLSKALREKLDLTFFDCNQEANTSKKHRKDNTSLGFLKYFSLVSHNGHTDI